jgi:DNA-directed RNA polymerase subunit RPC12/RpoP
MAREQQLIVEIESAHTAIACRYCGHTISEFVGYDRPCRVPGLSFAGGTARVVFYPKRFRCPYCAEHPTTAEAFRWPADDGTKANMVGG